MRSLPSFEPSQPVFLESGSGEETEGRRGVIEAVQDGRLTIAATDDERFDDAFATGGQVTVTYLTRSGVYTFQATVTRAGRHSLSVDLPAGGERVQRRQYVRTPVPIDVACLFLDEEHNRFTPFDARVRDVGGGGAALMGDVIAPRGAVVALSLALPGDRPVLALGSVLSTEGGRGPEQPHVVRVQFTNLLEPDRDRLMRFVFASLRERPPEHPAEP